MECEAHFAIAVRGDDNIRSEPDPIAPNQRRTKIQREADRRNARTQRILHRRFAHNCIDDFSCSSAHHKCSGNDHSGISGLLETSLALPSWIHHWPCLLGYITGSAFLDTSQARPVLVSSRNSVHGRLTTAATASTATSLHTRPPQRPGANF